MILADTSVWIHFLRGDAGYESMSELVREKRVVTHPWVIGELLVGHLGGIRNRFLKDLEMLPRLKEYPLEEIRRFVDLERLFGCGISWVDCQLLYAAILEDCPLWRSDQPLNRVAAPYNIQYRP